MTKEAIDYEADAALILQFTQQCGLKSLSNFTPTSLDNTQTTTALLNEQIKNSSDCINQMNALSFHSVEYQKIKNDRIQVIQLDMNLMKSVQDQENKASGNNGTEEQNLLSQTIKLEQQIQSEDTQVQQKIGALDAQLPTLETQVNGEYGLLQNKYHFESE